MAVNWWQWLEILKMAGNGRNDWKWLDMAEMDNNGFKLLEMA